jgi:hypothetical protein
MLDRLGGVELSCDVGSEEGSGSGEEGGDDSGEEGEDDGGEVREREVRGISTGISSRPSCVPSIEIAWMSALLKLKPGSIT